MPSGVEQIKTLAKEIKDNVYNVYDAGKLNVVASAQCLKGLITGNVVAANDVSPLEHDLQVQLSSDTITDFSSVKVQRYGLNLLKFPYYDYGYSKSYEINKPFTRSGVEFTFFADGRIKAVGTATSDAAVNIGRYSMIKGLSFYDTGGVNSVTGQKGYSFSPYICLNSGSLKLIFIHIPKGKTIDTILEPMWVKGTFNTTTMPAFELYREPQTVTANTDGTVDGLTSISPNITLIPDTEGVVVDCEYYKDIDSAYLQDAIIPEATGEAVAISDSLDLYLQGLNVYGKTTQAGTPSPENPQGLETPKDALLKVNGANILPDDFWDFNSGKWTATGDYYLYHLDIPDGTTITLSAPHSTGELAKDLYVNIGLAVSNSKMWLYHPTSTTFNHNAITVTAENGEGIYIRMYLPKNYLTALREAGLWVNIGTETQLYEPYIEQSLALPILNEVGLAGVPVTSGGNYTDSNGKQWICDEIDFTRGVYIQRVAEKILNGTENWVIDGKYLEDNSDWYYSTGPFADAVSDGIGVSIVCDHYKTDSIVNSSKNQGIGLIWKYIRIRWGAYSDAMTIDEWKSYLAENPITVQYALATPIETPLDEEILSAFAELRANKPNTTITTSIGAGLSVKYIANPSSYINNIALSGGE